MGEVKVTKVNVFIDLLSKETIWGHVYLQEGERLQDLMNDSRLFLPVTKEPPGRHAETRPTTVIINKQTIAAIEER